MSNAQWHRLFGLSLKDLFPGTCFEVELEKDLSEQVQLLDIVVVRRSDSRSPKPGRDQLPDGLHLLRGHNLISFKSMHEPFDSFALVELMGHMVAYAKLVGRKKWRSFCKEDIALFAVCMRKPSTAALAAAMQPTDCGDVYKIDVSGFTVHCIVLSKAAANRRNALWNLFSARAPKIKYGADHYDWKSPETSTILRKVFAQYLLEGLQMPYTMDDYLEEVIPEILEDLTPERRKEVLKRISAEERLEGLAPGQVLERLSAEQILEGLPPEQLHRLARMLAEKDGGGAN
jgi:hypothetical protein